MHVETRVLSRRVHAACRAADWWAVDVACPAFEQILDAKIAAQLAAAPQAPWAVDARPDPGLRVAMAGGAGWPSHAPAGHVRGYAETGSRVGVEGTARSLPPPVASRGPAMPPRPRLALSTSGREALERLRQWGADLPDDFTADELKRAYRHLARQFHPDHHATASAATRAALGSAFHQIHVAYRQLAQ